MNNENCQTTIKDLEELFEKMKPKENTPHITYETKLYASLSMLALYADDIAQIEKLTNKDVLWNPLIENASEGESILIINPPKPLTFNLPLTFEEPERYGKCYNFCFDHIIGNITGIGI